MNTSVATSTDNQLADDEEDLQAPHQPALEQPPKRKSHTKIYWISTAAVLVLATAACVGYLFSHRAPASPSSDSSKSSSQAPISTAPAVEKSSFGDVKAAYVTLPLTRAQTETDPIYTIPRTVTSSGGHYLVVDPSGVTYGPKNLEGGKLIYDGKTVYDGPNLWQFVLSANGQHYAYLLDTSVLHNGGNIELYLDGKLVQTVPDGNGVYDLQIANNGKDYIYMTGHPKATWADTDLVKDGTVIYTNQSGLRSLYFDVNLEHYIATTNPSASNKYDIVWDGKTIDSDGDFAGTIDPPVAISPNGGHYLYADGGTLYLDGKQVLQPKDTAAIGVADTGDYTVVNAVANKVTTTKVTYSIPSEYSQVCNPGCGGAFPEFAMSNDGLHYAYGTRYPNLWNLDGSTITPVGDIENIEFIGDTLYLYRWTPDRYSGWQTYSNNQVSFKYPSAWTASMGRGVSRVADATSQAFTSSAVTTARSPGAQITEYLRLDTDSSTIDCASAPCQVTATIAINNPQFPGAVLAFVNQTSPNGTSYTQYVVADGKTKVGDTTINAVQAGSSNTYIFGQPYYYPQNDGLPEAARVTDIAGFQSDSHTKDLVNIINSIKFN